MGWLLGAVVTACLGTERAVVSPGSGCMVEWSRGQIRWGIRSRRRAGSATGAYQSQLHLLGSGPGQWPGAGVGSGGGEGVGAQVEGSGPCVCCCSVIGVSGVENASWVSRGLEGNTLTRLLRGSGVGHPVQMCTFFRAAWRLNLHNGPIDTQIGHNHEGVVKPCQEKTRTRQSVPLGASRPCNASLRPFPVHKPPMLNTGRVALGTAVFVRGPPCVKNVRMMQLFACVDNTFFKDVRKKVKKAQAWGWDGTIRGAGLKQLRMVPNHWEDSMTAPIDFIVLTTTALL